MIVGELPLVLFTISGTGKVHEDDHKIKPQIIFLVRQVGGGNASGPFPEISIDPYIICGNNKNSPLLSALSLKKNLLLG